MNHELRRNPIDIIQTLKLNNDLWNTKKERDALRQQLDDVDDAFEDTISAFPEVFQTDLPGYNNHFGPVYASIEFGSRARPPPHKTRVPSYGSHGLKLFNQKAMAMVDKGVLIDPYKLGVQPSLILDAWVVKKPAFAKLPWEECQEKHDYPCSRHEAPSYDYRP